MTLTVSRQLLQLIAAFGAGALLGLVYDVLRAFRRAVKSDAFFDVLFCAFLLSLLFYLGMSLGDGALKLSMFIFSVLGFAAYLISIGRLIVSFLNKAAKCVVDSFQKLLNPMKNLQKKFFKSTKSIFSNTVYRFIIAKKSRRNSIEGSTEDNFDSGACTAHIRYGEPRKGELGAAGRDGAVRGAEGADRGH